MVGLWVPWWAWWASRRSAGEVADCEVTDCLKGGELEVAVELVDCRLREKGLKVCKFVFFSKVAPERGWRTALGTRLLPLWSRSQPGLLKFNNNLIK